MGVQFAPFLPRRSCLSYAHSPKLIKPCRVTLTHNLSTHPSVMIHRHASRSKRSSTPSFVDLVKHSHYTTCLSGLSSSEQVVCILATPHTSETAVLLSTQSRINGSQMLTTPPVWACRRLAVWFASLVRVLVPAIPTPRGYLQATNQRSFSSAGNRCILTSLTYPWHFVSGFSHV